MQYSNFTPATMRPGTHAAHLAWRAGPAPLGISDVVDGVLDPHRAAVTPSPEWHRLGCRLGTILSALVGRVLDAARVRAPRRA